MRGPKIVSSHWATRIRGIWPTGEEDQQQEEQPRNGVGHNEAAPNSAHSAEQVDGELMRQEAD